MKKLCLLLPLLLVAASCTKIDYVGEEYPPTNHVDMYFSMADAPTGAKVMGYIVASAPDMVSAEKMQKKMMEKARVKGADGIVIEGLNRYQAGSNTNYSESSTQKTDSKGKTKTTTSGSSSTSSEEKKEIKGTLLKYR
ncbi:hypothetical protein C3F09_00905 [candidate division GN15 bacterium]|uniref:Lipoprotein n=1 Tax=candidate division GN15 bacterium TaxID=2072418 RepID=A0A855X692_9BACT|nr:MAG: hypothetical protein C3F09_00905 [candidate division GN15 bacterium]